MFISFSSGVSTTIFDTVDMKKGRSLLAHFGPSKTYVKLKQRLINLALWDDVPMSDAITLSKIAMVGTFAGKKMGYHTLEEWVSVH